VGNAYSQLHSGAFLIVDQFNFGMRLRPVDFLVFRRVLRALFSITFIFLFILIKVLVDAFRIIIQLFTLQAPLPAIFFHDTIFRHEFMFYAITNYIDPFLISYTLILHRNSRCHF
jgi:hypothetical protein